MAVTTTFGPMLETFALQELKRQASGRADPIRLHHYRDRDDFEVDIRFEAKLWAAADALRNSPDADIKRTWSGSVNHRVTADRR